MIFFRFEDKKYDLPFLNGDSRFTTKNVVILLIGFLICVVTGFIMPPDGNVMLRAILFAIPQLLVVVYVFDNYEIDICNGYFK